MTTITVDTTYTVGAGGDYPSIPAAITAISDYHIQAGVILTIQLLAEDHTITSSVVLSHPYGCQIKICGATPQPLTFDSFVSSSSFGLGLSLIHI